MKTSLKKQLIFAAAASSIMAGMPASFAHGVMRSDAELIKVLRTAAPAVIVDHATIMNMGEDGKMKVIQKGTNGWTCMDPGTHDTGEPMCADKAAMDWADSWQNKKPPTAPIGLMYMLNGDSGVSNTDPYDTSPKPTPTNNWVQTGPHIMLVGTDAKTMIESYPKDAKADSSQPYVMWPGTPYEHLMIPVK